MTHYHFSHRSTKHVRNICFIQLDFDLTQFYPGKQTRKTLLVALRVESILRLHHKGYSDKLDIFYILCKIRGYAPQYDYLYYIYLIKFSVNEN